MIPLLTKKRIILTTRWITATQLCCIQVAGSSVGQTFNY